MSSSTNDRIDIRLNKEQKELIQYASQVQGYKSVSEFVVSYMSKAAKEIIQDNDVILKGVTDKKAFVEALTNPPMPNASLKKAALDYQKYVAENAPSDKTPSKKAR